VTSVQEEVAGEAWGGCTKKKSGICSTKRQLQVPDDPRGPDKFLSVEQPDAEVGSGILVKSFTIAIGLQDLWLEVATSERELRCLPPGERGGKLVQVRAAR